MSDQGAAVVVPFLRRHGARAIELLAISHPHLDHFGGTAALFDAFPVRAVVDPAVREPSAAYLGFLERTLREPARWMSASAGDRFRVDDVEIDVLWPTDVAGLGANEGSLSFVLRIGEADGPDGDPRAEDESGRAPFVYVNTGDAPQEVEAAILSRRDGPPDADLLKVGHHGSHTSSALAWLRATRPEIAVISAGRGNRYGHPHAVTLARLDSARVGRVWRTDRDGTLCIEVREDGWHVTSRRSRHAA